MAVTLQGSTLNNIHIGNSGSGGGGAISAVYSASRQSSTSTTSTSYVNMSTPVFVTATTGTDVLVSISGQCWNDTVDKGSFMCVNVSGASNIPASDGNAASIAWFSFRGDYPGYVSRTYRLSGLTPGSNTFAVYVKANGGTANVNAIQLVVQTLA